MHIFIDNFNPSIELLTDENRELLNDFCVGESKEDIAFATFVKKEAKGFCENYEGVTYLIINQLGEKREVVGYYTITTKALLLKDEVEEDGDYDTAILEIPALEIKMFAIDKKYQDVFFEFEGIRKPVSAWVFEEILRRLDNIALCCVGFKAIFLRAIQQAEDFYVRNGFNFFTKTMLDTFSIDTDLKPMFHRLTKIKYNEKNRLVEL